MTKFLSNIFLGTALILSGCNTIPKSYIIPQRGMYPTFVPNTQVWATMNPYNSIADIQYGDIIVFVRLQDGVKYNYIWRVIALANDTISMLGTDVWLNNVKLDHKLVREENDFIIYRELQRRMDHLVAYKKDDSTVSHNSFRAIVPSGNIFVLGDNRDDAADSRYLGTIEFESIIAKIK